MPLPMQLFGTIETSYEILEAMFCRDHDCPNQAMVHWWGEKVAPRAILVQLLEEDSGNIKLIPQELYQVDRYGAVRRVNKPSNEDNEFVQQFTATLQRKNGALVGEWIHESDRKGRVSLSPYNLTDDLIPDNCTTWDEFKAWAKIARIKNDAVIFRGHGSNKFRLRTTLSRVGRHRLERYDAESLPKFREHSETVLGQRFDLNDIEDYSTLLGLAQHHGLPTPLLDWTDSPYIAAFFAFSDAVEFRETRSSATHVRVYGLTRDFVDSTRIPVVTVPFYSPYIISLSILPRNNPRLYVQQGKFLITNVADVEQFICSAEKRSGIKYLIAADIPIGCAFEALEDLEFMGLSAATMFPGLDGVCRMMKHKMLFKA